MVGSQTGEATGAAESMSAAAWSMLLVVYALVYLAINLVAVLGVQRRFGGASGTGST